ncbi:hypothetical protein FRC08_005143 [Ceratobasidium sp. 394]|nr:hypothetical protein FRC08_005143 [Ceratobasidium sp. 394]
MSKVYEIEDWTDAQRQTLHDFFATHPHDDINGLTDDNVTQLTALLCPQAVLSEVKSELALSRFSSESPRRLGYVASQTRTFSVRVTAWNEHVLRGTIVIYQPLDGLGYFRMAVFEINEKPCWYHVWTFNCDKIPTSHFQAKIDFPAATEISMGVWHGIELDA